MNLRKLLGGIYFGLAIMTWMLIMRWLYFKNWKVNTDAICVEKLR